MYRITQALSVGRFATPEKAAELRAGGVTHVLNVSDFPSEVAAGPDSFREVAWVPVRDLRRVSEGLADRVLDTLHRLAAEPDAHVYVHCVAGQRRAPTVVWLYLIACGYPPDFARDLIEARSPDAAPGHGRLSDPDLILHVQKHGLTHYLPLRRGEVIVPFG